MKNKVISVLIYPYRNKLEVRVTRAEKHDHPKNVVVRVYTADYSDYNKVIRLANLAARLNNLVLLNLIDYYRSDAVWL